MKAKLLILSAIVALSLTMPAFARTRVVQTRSGQAVVTNSSNHRSHWRSDHWRGGSGVSWSIGIGLPFYGAYYGGYPYYGGYSYGGYPYYSGYSYGGYPYSSYGYRSYPYGYGYSNNYYSGSSYPYYSNRSVYRGYNGSVVARVQERLARAGYYRGPIDGVMGPRTRYAIRVYERRHGLPADGIIDRRLLATMGIA
jgi:putative peptidoglycan binding protein